MFGFVVANAQELTEEQMIRYRTIYCGICRRIRLQCSSACRLGLSYDMAFLALLLTCLYEPEETAGNRACGIHPLRPRPWADNSFIRYCAQMNVALSYYKALDDYRDERKLTAKMSMRIFEKSVDAIADRYPRQCNAIETCVRELTKLEKARCDNPDLPANCFGKLMGELFVVNEDHWSQDLRTVGMHLGRFIYLADAAIDYRRDKRKHNYNPFIAMGTGEDWSRWEDYLVLDMAKCTEVFERLPMVQNLDKTILDNILYSGIWLAYRRKQRGGAPQA